MNNNAMFKLSYGLFVLTANCDGKDNGCIINTFGQVTETPNQVSMCVNNTNFTHEMIMKSGIFNISVISRDADFELFKHFGFSSGAHTDKFENYKDCKRAKNGIMYVTKGTNAYICVKVTETKNLGTHTMFIGEVTDCEILADTKSATYDYYFENIKPKNNSTRKRTVWRCRICGYEYEGENLPENYICPLCKHPASEFEKITV